MYERVVQTNRINTENKLFKTSKPPNYYKYGILEQGSTTSIVP